MIPVVTTPRLTLRPFQTGDVPELHSTLQAAGVLRYFPSTKPPSFEAVERLIQGQHDHWEQHGYGWWAVTMGASQGDLLGWCGLGYLTETDEVEVAYLMGKPYWGRGLATEAAREALRFGFEKLRVEEIVGIVHPENKASQRVLAKLGLLFLEENRYFGMDVHRYRIDLAQYTGVAAAR